MSKPDRNLFDESFWREIARSSPELADNPDGAEHLAYRFVGQYLPALLRANTKEDSDDVWLAFWSYLVARGNKRKLFALSTQAADRLIAEFQQALSEAS
jgi:hypothetical protein